MRLPVVRNTDISFGSLAALFTNSSLMSAFPESGRSDQQNFNKMTGRFRPEAVVHAISIVFAFDKQLKDCLHLPVNRAEISQTLSIV